MSADIGVGDFVEYVGCGVPTLPRRTVARVEGFSHFGDCPCGDRQRGLLLSIDHGPDWDGWCASAWQPIYRPRATFIESLKTPAPSDPVPA